MKRRSFLAMIGLAPVAGATSSANAASQKSVNRQLLDGDIPVPTDAISMSWACPMHQARCDAAHAAGLPQPSVSLRMVRVEQTKDHCGFELQVVDDAGQVVIRQWNRK